MTARETILSGERARSALMAVALATFAAVLIALSARAEIHLWFTPVPITLQVLVVLLIGLSLTPRQSFLALAEYIGAGIVGLPVFSGGGSGIAWLLGPTGGYIWGFLFAAPLVGILALWLGQRWTIVAALAGIAVIYVLGWYHLSQWYFLVRDEQSPWMLAYRNGVEPFVLIDIAKAIVAVILVYGGTRLGLSLPGAKK